MRSHPLKSVANSVIDLASMTDSASAFYERDSSTSAFSERDSSAPAFSSAGRRCQLVCSAWHAAGFFYPRPGKLGWSKVFTVLSSLEPQEWVKNVIRNPLECHARFARPSGAKSFFLFAAGSAARSPACAGASLAPPAATPGSPSGATSLREIQGESGS